MFKHNHRHMRGPFGHGRGFSRHHGGGRERLFDQGDLKFVLLRLIAEDPAHGYELIRRIEERLGGVYSPSPGVIYPTLQMLEEMGYAAVTPDGDKKRYAATGAGLAWLTENETIVTQIFARMAELRSTGTQGAAIAPVMRAMENLKTALRLRTTRGPLSEAQAARIAAAIDHAALETEKE